MENSTINLLKCAFIATMIFAGQVFGQIKRAETGELAVQENKQEHPWTLVIHGGAGGPVKGARSDEEDKAYLLHLNEALSIGGELLASGKSSLDVVEFVVRYLEDCPLFNAGKGAVLNEDGLAELDASIMDGKTGMAGAVAGVKTIKNPVSAARRVMEKTRHVMLAGSGADQFAKLQGLEIVGPDYFITPDRLEAWKKWKEERTGKPTHQEKSPGKKTGETDKTGTVGAVALDRDGNLAAATSTGGMMGKAFGRIGDSPIIGAGTYANNSTCAVSATGHGEFFIRNVVAYDLSAMMEYGKIPLEEAANLIVGEKLKHQGASGGLIAVDRDGNIAMPFNTNSMFRGYVRSDGARDAAIY